MHQASCTAGRKLRFGMLTALTNIRSKKLKCQKQIKTNHFSIKNDMISSQKKFEIPEFPPKFGSDLFKGEKKLFQLWGSWYSNRPARTHGFNAKIGFEKYAPSTEISAKMCQILLVWFGRPILDTFLVISWDSVHIFQNRFCVEIVSTSRSI